jgi:hypothetical protein
MSTGFERVVNTVVIEINSGTVYTAPSGRYCRVYVKEITLGSSSSLSISGVGYASTGGGQTFNYPEITPASVQPSSIFDHPIIMNAGEVTFCGASASAKLFIEEYNEV